MGGCYRYAGEHNSCEINPHNILNLIISISLDAPVMLEFDPESLATTGRKTYKNTITSFGGIELFSTAHPHLQFENNEFVTYNYFLEFVR